MFSYSSVSSSKCFFKEFQWIYECLKNQIYHLGLSAVQNCGWKHICLLIRRAVVLHVLYYVKYLLLDVHGSPLYNINRISSLT